MAGEMVQRVRTLWCFLFVCFLGFLCVCLFFKQEPRASQIYNFKDLFLLLLKCVSVYVHRSSGIHSPVEGAGVTEHLMCWEFKSSGRAANALNR